MSSLVLSFALVLLLVIAAIDMRAKVVPDALTIPFILLAFVAAFVMRGVVPVAGPTVAAAFFGVQWILSRGRWIGSCDVLLAFGIGALLARPAAVLLWLLFTYMSGAVVAFALLAMGKANRNTQLAFSPFMVIALIFLLVFGDTILEKFY